MQNPLSRWPKAVDRLTAISSLLYILSRFLPSMLPSQYTLQDSIDDAWGQALHLDFVNHLQFGREVVFTYGPWGFLSRGYCPETHGIAMLAWTVLSLIFWLAAWRLAAHFCDNRIIAWAWVTTFSAVATLPSGDDINARLVAWTVLPLLLHFFVEDGKFTPLQGAIAVCWGLLSLTKFSGAIEGIAVYAVIGLDDLRRRKIPRALPLLVASMLLFWMLAHQQLGSIIPYVTNSLRITSGYTDAMMSHGSTDITHVLSFTMLAGAVLTLACIICWKQLKFPGALVLMALVVMLFLIFKGGFVRMDAMHEIGASMGLLLIALAVMSVAWRNQSRGTGLFGVLLVLACTLWASSLFMQHLRALTLIRLAAHTLSPGSLAAPFQAAFTDALPRRDLANRQSCRAQYPLPPVSGGSDLYTMYLQILFAQGMNYDPRPVLQSYSAYSAELSELNAAFLRSPAAPTNVFFSLATIDSRYPTLDDSRSWPALLTRYDLKGMSSTNAQFLLMRRANNSRSCALDPVTNLVTHFGCFTSVPDTSDGPIWIEIDFAKSFKGKLLTFLYKPQGLTMTITTRAGVRHTFRVIPGMTQSGFLLSPCISNTESFAWFAGTGGRTGPDEVMVTAIEFGTDSGSNTCYQSAIPIRFYRLQFPPQQNLITEQQAAK
jgi:hypothetical protein